MDHELRLAARSCAIAFGSIADFWMMAHFIMGTSASFDCGETHGLRNVGLLGKWWGIVGLVRENIGLEGYKKFF